MTWCLREEATGGGGDNEAGERGFARAGHEKQAKAQYDGVHKNETGLVAIIIRLSRAASLDPRH